MMYGIQASLWIATLLARQNRTSVESEVDQVQLIQPPLRSRGIRLRICPIQRLRALKQQAMRQDLRVEQPVPPLWSFLQAAYALQSLPSNGLLSTWQKTCFDLHDWLALSAICQGSVLLLCRQS